MYLIAHTCTHLTNIIIKFTIFTKILITIRHLQNKAIEFLYVFVFWGFFCLIQRRQWSNSELVPVCGLKKKTRRGYMGPDHQVSLNCKNLLHSFYRYIHSIFVVFLHGHYDIVLFDKFTMPKTTHKKHLGIMSSKQIHLFITSCTKPIYWLNHCGDFMDNVLLCEISSELNCGMVYQK